MRTIEILTSLGKSTAVALVTSTAMVGFMSMTIDAVRSLDNETSCDPEVDLKMKALMAGTFYLATSALSMSFFYHKAKTEEAQRLVTYSNNFNPDVYGSSNV